MSEVSPQYRYGFNIGVAHHLDILQGGYGVFDKYQQEQDACKKHIKDGTARAIAYKIFELTEIAPPVLVVGEQDYNSVCYICDEDGQLSATVFADQAIDGPVDAVKLVDVPEDSDYFYAANRVDKIHEL